MNRILFLACLLFPLLARAANPAFTQFNTNHFTTNGYFISARGFPTNASIATSVTNIIDTQLTNGNMVYVDARVGSDVLARRWSFNWPNLTPLGGKNTATNGDTVYVRPGTYTTGVTNLGKNMVDWHFINVTLTWTEPATNGPGAAILIDDRYSGGAVTSTISGTLSINYSSGTNHMFDASCNVYLGNQNALGAIVITNPATRITLAAHTTTKVYGNVGNGPYALYISDCHTASYFNLMGGIGNWSPFVGNVITVTNCPADPIETFNVGVKFSGIYWELGTFTADIGPHEATPGGIGYAVYAYGETNTDNANMYLRFHGKCEAKIYMVGFSRNWKSWIDGQEFVTTNSPTYAAYGTASHYFRAMKVSELGNINVPISTVAANGHSNGTLWVDIQKVSGGGGWVDSGAGELRGTISHFESLGAMPNSGIINRLGATLSLDGLDAYAPNHVVQHIAGDTTLRNYRLYSTNRPPVLVSGAGYIGQNTIMVGATNCIYSTAAQTVKLYGHNMANTNEHSNVTISMGTLSVNGAVQ